MSIKTIPVLEEAVSVSKHTVVTAVTTLEKQIESKDYVVSDFLKSQGATVERISFGTAVDASNPPQVRTVDGLTIIPILEEILVVEKRLVLKEELHIRHYFNEVPVAEQVTLRTENVMLTCRQANSSDEVKEQNSCTNTETSPPNERTS